MSTLKFTEEHEWIRLEGEIATVGITDYAQNQLGDVVYVEPVAALLSRKSGRPVKLTMQRDEVFQATGPTPGRIAAHDQPDGPAPGQAGSGSPQIRQLPRSSTTR